MVCPLWAKRVPVERAEGAPCHHSYTRRVAQAPAPRAALTTALTCSPGAGCSLLAHAPGPGRLPFLRYGLLESLVTPFIQRRLRLELGKDRFLGHRAAWLVCGDASGAPP